MVFLKRGRNLSLKGLKEKPSDNLSTVHETLNAGLEETYDLIRKLESSYYGPGKKSHDRVLNDVKKWSSHVKSVVTSSHVGVLQSPDQMEDIIKNAGDPSKKFKVDQFALNKTKEVLRKVQDYVPYKLKPVSDNLKSILQYLEKYCLSFYDSKSGVDFETAKEYEEKRQEWRIVIEDNIETITSLANKFKKSESGLTMQDFSAYGKEIGQKGGCLQCMFLALFPEVCENIRIAMKAIKEWIEADQCYALYISYDLTDLEAKKDSFLKSMRDLQQRYASLCFGLKNLDERCLKLQKDLDRLKEKEDELNYEEEALLEESNEVQLEIDRKEWRRGELLKNHHAMHPDVFQEKFNDATEILRDMKSRLPFIQRQLFAVRHKLAWINVKRDEVEHEQKKKDTIQKEIESMEQDRLEHEIEYESIVKILDLAKHIYKCKSTPDSVMKIFYGQAVEINNARLPGNKGAKDPFEISCKIIANHIHQDWPRFYRTLPFSPGRGLNTIDQDIAELSMLEQRIGPKEVAVKCLHRWRRFHTRAKQEDLFTALRKIRRKDIITAIERRLDPSKFIIPDIYDTPTGHNENNEPIVEDYLIPYLREIEKYDRLKAAGRIA